MRNCAGPTGHPACQLFASVAAVTGAAFATKTSGTAGAGAGGLGADVGAGVGADGRGVAEWVGAGARVLRLGVAAAGLEVGVGVGAAVAGVGGLDATWLGTGLGTGLEAGLEAAGVVAIAGLSVRAELAADFGCPLVHPATRARHARAATAAHRTGLIWSG